jgi:hypothetical protein
MYYIDPLQTSWPFRPGEEHEKPDNEKEHFEYNHSLSWLRSMLRLG